ncbi:MAG: hypothetical protein Q8M24_02640 [Pseudolabrys sp.]|nr:hypothetical protein [Pseudolabrys sp.]MDP2294343.1 hypothetical protein [Pseudolabrys sp.]
MPWFRNHYVCKVCGGHWLAEGAESQEADCPHCRAYGVMPYKSDDWTCVIEPLGNGFVVLECTRVNAHGPDYKRRKRFPSREAAQEFIRSRAA